MVSIRVDILSTIRIYEFESTTNIADRQFQNTPNFNLIGNTADKSLLSTLFGQKREIVVNFLISERDDAYWTGSTDLPNALASSIKSQKEWLRDGIFTVGGDHTLTDDDGNSYSGRIIDLTFRTLDNEPTFVNGQLRFLVGVNPI